jgi:hypothetical protein
VYTVDSLIRNVTFAPPRDSLTGVTLDYDLHASFNGTPNTNSTTVQTLQNPLVGKWYLLYVIRTNISSNFIIDQPSVVPACVNQTAGEYCLSTIETVTTSIANPADLGYEIPLSKGSWMYYEVSSVAPEPFWVSVHSDSLSDLSVYVRLGALPNPDQELYDYMNCNVPGQCGYAYIINLNDTASALPAGLNYTFYVGITATANLSYSIWWSSTCAPLCLTANDANSGDCSFSGNNVGACVCHPGYKGFDCSLETGLLPIQYIVLIVIACLVGLSALIGFFVWVRLQCKKNAYTTI